jgi:aryl-alcohol dehydrogenase-like predicted oxidoreductase
MQKQRFGRTGLSISPVIFGGIINMYESLENAQYYVDFAVDAGVNYFDVAPTYNDAESRLGPTLKKHRADVYLACKTTKRDAAGAKEELLHSLAVLETGYFDVYQLHAITTQADLDQAFGQGGAFETFLWARKEGLIRNIGFSAHHEGIALEACRLYDFDTVLFPMNWALGLQTGWGDRIAEEVKRTDKGLLCMKTMVSRLWREGEPRVYPKSWCRPVYDDDRLAIAGMKYGLAKGGAALVPPGDFEHFLFMLKNIDACLSHPLTEDDLAYLKLESFKVKDELIFKP